jgi:hypothetical protein
MNIAGIIFIVPPVVSDPTSRLVALWLIPRQVRRIANALGVIVSGFATDPLNH